ncbi:G-protein coupled receptor dmsr-1-like isoform X2 [Ostrea edulis]|uniref:G-protein coupled receptor dmsr-1-like isoform X2 n=1 Tax=Ostrea edulis TaxID=37623 RepID=UPI0020952179|nr:G-protein coupled receptor dmsr-1-like isoform X2 [Ostrea edulis]
MLKAADTAYCTYRFSAVNCDETMKDNQSVTGGDLLLFARTYASYHGYISICVCIFGIVTNVFNITVLTRKHMRTPVNLILTWLAVSDIITMMSYLPFAMHFYCIYPAASKSMEKNSQSWMAYMIFHINLAATTHTVSIWLCVMLAIVRYLHIRSPTKANSMRLQRIKQSRFGILFIYVSSALILVPNYMSNKLLPDVLPGNNETIYVLRNLNLGKNDTETMVLINVWVYAFTAKLVPCLLMSIFGSLLIYNIHVKIRQRRKILQISGASSLRLSEHSRTTKMLLAVIILFLVTELPQGILIILSACVENFFDQVYLPLGDVMDIVALVNNAVNFILYCSMSTKFRETFVHLFCTFHPIRRSEDSGYTLTDRLAKLDSHSNNNENNHHLNLLQNHFRKFSAERHVERT